MKSATLKALFSRYEQYCAWLKRQELSEHSRRSYKSRVNHFLEFAGIELDDDEGENVISDKHGRDYVVAKYKSYLKLKLKLKPASVNTSLAGVDHFYNYLKLGRARIKREDLPQLAPRALRKPEQKKLQLAIARSARAMDRAIATLLLNTGLRIGECAALDLDDVPISQRKGKVIVRSGKGDRYREVPLNGDAREAVKEWLEVRLEKFTRKFGDSDEQALFINPQGRRLSTSSIDAVVRKIGREAGIDLSAHTLRHSCLTNLVRNNTDLVLVAGVAGHKRVETTRRYTLPTQDDLEEAMNKLTSAE